MKTTNNNFASKFALAAFLALGTLAVTSCNKENNQAGQEVPTGNSQLIVRIAGISDGENISTKGTKSSTSNTSSSAHSVELVQSNGFDAIVAIDNNVPSIESAPIAQAGLKASNGTRAASAPMEAGTKYRLFLYKKNGMDYVYDQSVEFSSGSEAPVAVTKGATYKWIAISYNSSTDMVPDRGTDDMFALPENKDVLYAASTTDFTVGETVEPINISFNRLYARIAIEVNTLGMFAPINSATIAVTGQSARSATVDLSTGALTLAASTGTPALTQADFMDIDGDASRKVAYFYTADPAAQNLSVSVTNLKIQLDNSTERDFGSTVLNQVKSITPEPGKSHRFLVGITESALTYGGVKWSRANLYYQEGSSNPYRFFHTNQQSNDQRSFFSYGGAKPGVLARQVLPQDPCALVYPANLWKTPAKADLDPINSNGLTGLLGDLNLNILGSTVDLLVDAQNLLAGNVAGAASGTGYTEFTATGTHPAYGAATSASNKLRFNYNGFMRDISLVENLIQLNLGSTYGTYTAFWTNDRSLSLPLNLLDLGVTHYLGNFYNGLFGINSGYKGFRSTNILSISLLGSADVIKSSLMNVRCVRNSAWNPNAPGYDPNPVLL